MRPTRLAVALVLTAASVAVLLVARVRRRSSALCLERPREDFFRRQEVARAT